MNGDIIFQLEMLLVHNSKNVFVSEHGSLVGWIILQTNNVRRKLQCDNVWLYLKLILFYRIMIFTIFFWLYLYSSVLTRNINSTFISSKNNFSHVFQTVKDISVLRIICCFFLHLLIVFP